MRNTLPAAAARPGEEPSVFVENESYWQPGLPKVNGIELRSIADGAAEAAAIAAGARSI
jgi:hypothetical protein